MRVIRKKFTVNNLILFFAFASFYIGARDFIKIYGNEHKLIKHPGVVQEKRMICKVNSNDEFKRDSLRTIKITLVNDENEYSISFSALAVNTLINAGDSVELFTLKPIGPKGNLVICDNGNNYSTNPNELFQILSKKYPTPVVDYGDYMSLIKANIWIAPIFSILLFIWYFLRRSNIKGLFSFYVGDKEIQIG